VARGVYSARDGPLVRRHDQVYDPRGARPAVRRRAGQSAQLRIVSDRLPPGLRASEVGLLRTDDIDSGALRIMVHRLKGSHSGAHPMQPDEAKALRAYLRGHRFVPSRVD
jgi:integrase